MRAGIAVMALAMTTACTSQVTDRREISELPVMRWDLHPQADEWTRATLSALDIDGAGLTGVVPGDVEQFCPGYASATGEERRAFWAGLLSAVAKHESAMNPAAKGGGGRWIGLMQIAPRTANYYDCDTSRGLTNGASNLACAVRIAASQVKRDNAIAYDGDGWAGLARDWAPMRSEAKRSDVAGWTRAQSYCQKR